MGRFSSIVLHKEKIIAGVLMLLVVSTPYAVFLMTQHQKKTVTYAATDCTPDAILVNPCRPWLGAWAKDYPQASTGVKNQILYHEQRIGKQVDLIKDYKVTGGVLSADDKYFVSRAGSYLLLTWKPAGSFGAGASSSANSSIDAMAASVKSVAPKKIFLSIWHEPENDVSAGTTSCSNAKGNAGSPSQYVAMWQNVRNRFNAAGVTNVVWTFIPMGYSGWNCLEKQMWPGNGLVDWVMWDPYGNGDNDSWTKTVSPFYDWMAANTDAAHAYTSKPWGLAEEGIHLNAQEVSGVSFWQGAKAALDANTYPRLKAYVVFDSSNGKPDNRVGYWCKAWTGEQCNSGQLVSDPNKQNAYNAFANDPVFKGTVTPPPAPDTTPPTITLTSPAAGATLKGSVGLSANASDNVAVAKVVFAVDGTTLVTDSNAPYAATLDTTKYSNAGHTIVATAYDAAGNKTPSQVSVSINNSSTPLNPTITAFTATPSTLTVGNAATLQWASANTINCSVNPDGPQKTALTSWRTVAYTSTGTKTYTLTCYNSAGKSVAATVNITVNQAPQPPAKPTLTADKTTVIPGGSVLLSWTSANATSCALNPGNITSSGGTGSKLMTNMQQNTTFSVACSNNAGSSSASLNITVSKVVIETTPTIDAFASNPSNVSSGGIAVLSWSTSNVAANGCALAPSPLTSAAANGSWQSAPLTQSASFTLTCKDSGGKTVSQSVSVTVNGAPAPKPPDPQPTLDPSVSTPIIKALGGQDIVNAGLQGTVKQGQLITLDPSNVLDEKKAKSIVRVEYYSGEKLVQTVNVPPYALNSKLLTPGSYTITERTYYIDGSESERTQDITIQNTAAVTPKRSVGIYIAIGVAVLVALVVCARLVGGKILQRRAAQMRTADIDLRPEILIAPMQPQQSQQPQQFVQPGQPPQNNVPPQPLPPEQPGPTQLQQPSPDDPNAQQPGNPYGHNQ